MQNHVSEMCYLNCVFTYIQIILVRITFDFMNNIVLIFYNFLF